jgi:hypothetical protein
VRGMGGGRSTVLQGSLSLSCGQKHASFAVFLTSEVGPGRQVKAIWLGVPLLGSHCQGGCPEDSGGQALYICAL